MGYSIESGIRDAKMSLSFAQKIAARYPDACLSSFPDGRERWCSDSVKKDATDVEIVTSSGGGDATSYFVMFVQLPGGRVYSRAYAYVEVVLHNLKESHSDAYRALVEAVKEASF
jgi:hypothetical protein